MKTVNFWVALAMVFVFTGCGEEPPPPPPPTYDFPIEATVLDIEGEPIAAVPVRLDGKVVGFTDAEGLFRGTVTEMAGTEVTIGVGELEGYHWIDDTEVVEAFRATETGDAIPVAINVKGESLRKEYMFWVKTKCGDGLEDSQCQKLPVLVNDVEITVTDEFGYAHFVLDEVPQTEIKILIDTPPLGDDIAMLPDNPSYSVTLGFESQVYMVEEAFENVAKGKRKVRKKGSSAKKKSTKKKSTKKKKKKKKSSKKKKKKSGNETIDLW